MKQLISRRSFLKAAGVTAAAASMAIGAPAASACWFGDKSDVTILYTNDVHTYIDKQSPKLTYAAIADLKQSYQNAGKDVLLVDAGDHVQGTAYGSMDEGASIIKLMNAAGYDVATPGNHEFDYGMDRAKAIMKEGNSLWVVPTYTNHPTWDWDKRHEENGYPFGMGLGRQVIDNRGNERSFFLVTFVDSNYRPEPVAGYQWVARWPVAGTGLHVGAGYLAAVSARGDYMWVPFPMPLPVAKIGTDDISFYGTYIPVTNVFFFYSTITIDDAKRRDLPLPATSAWSADRNYLYGGWGWEYMDNGEEFSPSNVKNDSSWHVGMRHYSGRHWATDVSYRRSEHDIKTAGTDTSKSYRFQTWAVQLQYNIDALDSLRLYAGGGLGYSKMKGPAGKDDSFHPVTSLGATYAVTKNVFVNAEMFTSFARYKGTVEARGDDYVLKPMATDFTLSLGVAF